MSGHDSDVPASPHRAEDSSVSNLREALARIRRISRPRDELGPFAIVAWAAQAHVASLLESVFYLAFRGKTGAGKGTSLEAACLLTPAGVVLSVTSEAYLATVLDEGRAIGIPEADRLIDRNPIIGKVLRDGYRRSAVAGLKVPREDGKGWENAERSIFGPKAFDFHVTIEPHLLGRTVVLEMEPDDSVDRALDAEKKGRHLAPVQKWLDREAKRVFEEWSFARVDALWDSPGFRREVETLGGKTGRDHVLGANLLLICRLFGWSEFEAEIPRLLAGRKSVQDWSDEAEVLDGIQAAVGESFTEETTLPTNLLLENLNTARAVLRLRPITFKTLGRALVDLGFRKGTDWMRETKGALRGRWVIRPYRVLTQLTQVAQRTAPTDSPPIEGGSSSPAVSDAPDAPVRVAQELASRVGPKSGAAVLQAGGDQWSCDLTAELNLEATLARFGLEAASAFPGVRFHGLASAPGRLVLVSRETARQVGRTWGTSPEPVGTIPPTIDTASSRTSRGPP